MTALLAFAVLILIFGLGSRLLARWAITGPMFFVAAGLLLSSEGLGVVSVDLEAEAVALLAEVTLAIILFTDAGRIDFGAVRHSPQMPIRLLAIAMPLSIALGIGVGVLVLTDLAFWEVAIVAAILAPTDAALGQEVLTNRAVPARIRQALNVEGGLNDGLSVPFLFVFIALAAIEGSAGSASFWGQFVAEQICLGVLVGIVLGAGGAWLFNKALSVNAVTGVFQQLMAIALAVVALLGAEQIGGNGFIAAFVAGIAAAQVCHPLGGQLLDFVEDEGQLLTLGTFFLFGVAFLAPRLDEITWPIALYAVLSLTLIRMIPVAISLLGLGLTRTTSLFVGWFGPRGLASIVLALIVLEEERVAGHELLFTVATVAIFFSVVAHGVTARPLSAAFGQHCKRVGAVSSPEMEDVVPIPTRFRDNTRDMA